MITLRTAQSGKDITIRLVETKAGEFLILLQTIPIGLTALNADMRTTDHAEADRLFDRAVAIAEAGLLKHPAWKSTSTNGARNVPIHQS